MAVYQMELMDRERVARDTMAFWLSTEHLRGKQKSPVILRQFVAKLCRTKCQFVSRCFVSD